MCHFLTIRKLFSGAGSEESGPEESHHIDKDSTNYAQLLLITIQYSAVAMVVVGTLAIIYNNEKMSLLQNHSSVHYLKKEI